MPTTDQQSPTDTAPHGPDATPSTDASETPTEPAPAGFSLDHPEEFDQIAAARTYFEHPLRWHAALYEDDPVGELARAARTGFHVQLLPGDDEVFGYYETPSGDRTEITPETSDFPGHPLLLRAGLTMKTDYTAPYDGMEYLSGFEHYIGPYYLGYLVGIHNGAYQKPVYTLIHESGTVVGTGITRIFPAERFDDFREDRFAVETPDEYQVITVSADKNEVYSVEAEVSAKDASLWDAPETDDRALQLSARVSAETDFTEPIFILTPGEFETLQSKIESLTELLSYDRIPISRTFGRETFDGIFYPGPETESVCTSCTDGRTVPLVSYVRETYLTAGETNLLRLRSSSRTLCRKCLLSTALPSPPSPDPSGDTDTDTDTDTGTDADIDLEDLFDATETGSAESTTASESDASHSESPQTDASDTDADPETDDSGAAADSEGAMRAADTGLSGERIDAEDQSATETAEPHADNADTNASVDTGADTETDTDDNADADVNGGAESSTFTVVR